MAIVPVIVGLDHKTLSVDVIPELIKCGLSVRGAREKSDINAVVGDIDESKIEDLSHVNGILFVKPVTNLSPRKRVRREP